MLKSRKLGSQGLEVAEIGLGCMGMTFAYGTRDDAESIATIHRAIELGCNFFDTAEIYGPYTNEELLGHALKGRREQAIIATKFGFSYQEGKRSGLSSRPETIRSAVEGSLRRLRTDHIDLLYQHRVDPQTPMEDVAGAVGELVREGKVRFFGLSEAGESNIRRAHAVHPVSVLQSEYSLWERGLEARIIPLLRELGIGLVAYSPLGRSFLTGVTQRAEEYSEGDSRRTHPRFQASNFDANQRLTAPVRELAARIGVKPSQIALAWLLHKGQDVVPIPGTKRRRYLEENLAAADVHLSAGEMGALEAALPPGATAGNRYNDQMMAYLDR